MIQLNTFFSTLFLICTLLLSACGASDNSNSLSRDSNNGQSSSDGTQGDDDDDDGDDDDNDSDGESNPDDNAGCGLDDRGDAPLSYEVRKEGQESYTTPAITTDNCLRVRFQVSSVGNKFFDNADLRVDISVNGARRIPLYTAASCPSNGCEYGRPSDGYSDIIDFSLHARSGSSPTVKIGNARYDWYCQIFAIPYPSCYRAVLKVHHWSGNLLVQTNTTSNELFESP